MRSFRDFMSTVMLPIGIWAAVIVGIWIGSIYMGRIVDTKVEHHEQEHAHCYTAGKMFFVSIACVPKR